MKFVILSLSFNISYILFILIPSLGFEQSSEQIWKRKIVLLHGFDIQVNSVAALLEIELNGFIWWHHIFFLFLSPSISKEAC